MNRTISGYFKNQLFVVRLLLNTEVLDRILDVANRCVNRVDCNHVHVCIRISVFISGNISATFVNRQLDLETCVRIQTTNNQLRIQYLESGQLFTNITGFEHFRTRNSNTYFFILYVVYNMLEPYLFQIQDNVCHILDNTGDCTKFMVNPFDFNGCNSKTFK